MTELISYGNQIRCGTYQLHSKFSSAANFFSDDAFVFVVDTRIGAGPLNIVLEGIKMDTLRSLEIKNNCIYLDDYQLLFGDSTRFDSDIQLEEINKNKFQFNMQFLENALIEYSPPKSLAFLMDNRRRTEFASSFDLAIMNRLEKGLKELLVGYYQSGVDAIKGLGYGLTPSGDDFISGFLIALNVCQQILKTDFSQIVNVIQRTARSSNSFTNIFLDCAARGQVSEKFQKLIYALCYSDEKNVVYCTQQLLTVGATSGADQAVGFLIGAKRFIQ
jgi:hypothetical protein